MLKTIRTKIIITYSLVMVAFISTLLLSTFFNERSRVLDLALEKSTEISKMHAELLNQEFSQYIAMLKVLSDSPQIKSNDLEKIQPQLKRLMEVGSGDFINTVYVDKYKNLMDSNGNKSEVTHPFFLKGDQWIGKEHNITTPLFSKFEEEPVVLVAVPILDSKKEWMGTIAAAVPIDVINDKLSAIKVTKGSYAWIANSNNVVVSHPDDRFLMVKISKTADNNFTGLSSIIRKTEQQEDGYGQYFDRIKNESKIVTFSKIHNLPGWNLFVTTEETEVFHDIYEVLYNVLITSFFLMIVFLIIIIKLSGKITKPLIQLTKDVKLSFEKKHTHFNLIRSDDEIGQLSQAFYETIQKINQHTHYLEEMVNDRTQEISTKNLILNEQNNTLQKIASTDSLTKLYNRHAFSALIEEEMLQADQYDSPATLIVLDIDHFKKINDQFGHDVGDDILYRLARELASDDDKDLICRWGGEEFVILLSDTQSNIASTYIETLREKISKVNFDPVGRLTFSAGIATAKPKESFREWFQRADKALYKAKESGRNKIEWG